MKDWRPQHFQRVGTGKNVPANVLANAMAAGIRVISTNRSLQPVFTLRHLAYLTESRYESLRAFVERDAGPAYTSFAIRKRPLGGQVRFRRIAIPAPTLMRVQRWISRNILAHAAQVLHQASTAYAKGCNVVDAARPHCGARWLLKVDVKNFFESISEIGVFRAFRTLGYQPLISFEMARLCTRLAPPSRARSAPRWFATSPRQYSISAYREARLGHLPQGAPTSPMLANLAMASLDARLDALAQSGGLTYTRYADDLTFSTPSREFTRSKAAGFIRNVFNVLGEHGLSPNVTKTQVVPPGARKIVLGLLVDQDEPRLSRQFKLKMRMHFHYLLHPQVGPTKHAAARNFSAVAALRNHIRGLVSYAAQVEPEYANELSAKLAQVKWPL
jgi:RNA-directed DNA polymerase